MSRRNDAGVQAGVLLCVMALAGCEILGLGDDEQPKLVVTERSSTTITLEWSTLQSSAENLFTVDYFPLATCGGVPPHDDVLRVTGRAVQLTGLAPATSYNIHVHALPHGGESTSNVVVSTLAAGAPATPVTAADYQAC